MSRWSSHLRWEESCSIAHWGQKIYINYLKIFCVEDLILPALYVFILSFMLIWAHIYYFVLFITQYYFILLLRMFSFGLWELFQLIMLIWPHIYYFVLFITQYYFNLLLRMFSFGLWELFQLILVFLWHLYHCEITFGCFLNTSLLSGIIRILKFIYYISCPVLEPAILPRSPVLLLKKMAKETKSG